MKYFCVALLVLMVTSLVFEDAKHISLSFSTFLSFHFARPNPAITLKY